MRLENVAAIVTGGGRGLGHAITLALAKEGADVTIVAVKDLKSAEDTVEEVRKLGRRAIAVIADIADKEAVDRMVVRTVEAFGKVDLLINNAAAGDVRRVPLMEMSVEDWDRDVAVTLKGAFLCGVATAKEMMKQQKGNIINIINASAHRCRVGKGALVPAKAAVLNLTAQMACEWAEYNIRVNGVSPGPMLTSRSKAFALSEEGKQRIAKVPLARMGEVEEYANVVVFLASEDSSYMTGQTLIVDGGSVHTWYLYR